MRSHEQTEVVVVRRNESQSKAFTLIELLVVIAIIALLIGILLPALGQARRSAQNVVAQANLRSLNTGTANYAGDSDDRIFSFTWRGGQSYVNLKNGKLIESPNDQVAAARQVQNILHRATGRQKGFGSIQAPEARLMHRRYSHLVLLDYLTDRQPEPIAASPFDRNLIAWQESPLEYIEDVDGNTLPYGSGGVDAESGYDMEGLTAWQSRPMLQLWPFASSYQMVPAAWAPDGINNTITYGPTDTTVNLMTVVNGNGAAPKLGRRRMTQVAHPAGKAFLFEEYDRFTNPDGQYFAYPDSRSNIAFFDGSVRGEVTEESNPGWNPGQPNQVWRQQIKPLDTFPEALGGPNDPALYCQRYRWTRHGLQGIDFGGKDVGTNGDENLITVNCVQ